MAKIAIDLQSGGVKEEKSEVIIGIDLGTTNSLVSIIKDGHPVIIKDKNGLNALVPSIVYFPKDNEEVIVGNEARRYLTIDPTRTVFSVKRLLGKSYKDLDGYKNRFAYQIIDENDDSLVKIRMDDKFYTPVSLSALILSSLKKRVESDLNQEVTKAVITVPAYFNDTQRQATRDAGKIAGLDVLRIINEPTAASLAYGLGLDRESSPCIAVFDLGGGTFDISILRIEDGVFEVLATHGDTFLGGDDIDQLIVDFWINKHQLFIQTSEEQSTIRLLAEQAKVSLSNTITYEANWNEHQLTITRNDLEALITPLVQRTLDACKIALNDSHLSVKDIDEVVMVGGSTRIPYIKDKVSAFFQRRVHDEINPDEVVAMGAAIQADILAGNRKDLLLLDITPLSLGIETVGGLMDIIIPRNSKVPCSFARKYTTSVDGQKNLKISVFQGERDEVSNNRKLGEFILSGIPPMGAGIPKIEVKFRLNADGILTVGALEERSGLSQQIEVRPQYGISEEEMARMLIDSIQNAKEDMAIKALKEAQNEGMMMVNSTEKFITQNEQWLSSEQVGNIRSLSEKLKMTIQGNHKDDIEKAIQDLNEYTTPLAHMAMERHVSNAMRGTKI
jgi:molecular chaperone HscA